MNRSVKECGNICTLFLCLKEIYSLDRLMQECKFVVSLMGNIVVRMCELSKFFRRNINDK